jgi:hypothetical protein
MLPASPRFIVIAATAPSCVVLMMSLIAPPSPLCAAV